MRDSGSKVISAALMARAMASDPQFLLPQQPRLSPAFAMIPVAEGLVFEGAPERQLLRGRAVEALLPKLLPLLDGTRTLDQLAQALPGLPGEAVFNAVSLLYSRGLLEDGAVAAHTDSLDGERLAFIQRNVDATRMNRSAQEAGARLASARVALVAPVASDPRFLEALAAVGFGSVTSCADPAELEQLSPTWVLGLGLGREPEALFQALDQACAALSIPWLRAVVGGSEAEIGPVFERGETTCYSCFRRQHAANLPDGVLSAFWAHRIALEIFHQVSRIGSPQERDMLDIQLATWQQSRFRPFPWPGCAACSTADAPSPEVLPVAYQYESVVSFPSRRYLVPRDHQIHYRPVNLEMTRDLKRHPAAPKVALPDRPQLPLPGGSFLDLLLTDVPGAETPLDLEHLASLLMLTSGLRTGLDEKAKVQRWAPTGGNLGSVHAFVLARSVQGLKPGLYSYESGEHLLAAIEPHRLQSHWEQVAFQLLPGAPVLPDAIILLVGALARVSHKYGPFGYRVIQLDAGVAAAQSLAVSRAFGWQMEWVMTFADDLATDILRLDPAAEQPTTLLAFWSRREETNPC